MKPIKCGQFSKSFKTSQKLTALLVDRHKRGRLRHRGDIATAAEKAGLKSVTVHAIDNRTKLPKVYVWYKGQRSIKEPQNDK